MKCASKYIGLVLLGAFAGAGVVHQWFLCPEAKYPACYAQTVENGYRLQEGLQYQVTTEKAGNKVTLKGELNVYCPIQLGFELLTLTPEGAMGDTLAENRVMADNGQFEASFDLKEQISAPLGVLIYAGLPLGEDAEFDFVRAVGIEYLRSPRLVKLLP